MKKTRLILLGIDGMDFDYARSMITDLPNIKKLSETGIFSPFRSVFPPDSIPSWITCYTGKNPSEHGVLESVNYLAKGDKRINVDTSVFQGRTFWDILGEAGNKVCVINPFMGYPVWPVNGVMINGPVFIDGNIQISDRSWVEGLTVPGSLGGIVDFPTRKTLGDFIKKTVNDTKIQADFGISMLRRHRPALFFQTFLTADRIQHFLWRYCDPSDPTYPGKNPFKDVIRNFYIETDRIIGRYLECLEPEDHFMAISDHGHGMRCTHCFNINEFLRRRGDLRSLADGKRLSSKLIIEKLKNAVLSFMNEHDLEDYISVIAKFVPNAKKIKKGKHITQSEKNRAYASDFTGTNPFGGICVNRSLVDNYEKFRDDLICELDRMEYKGEPVFEWIKKREAMFDGTYTERFPDILFCLKERYGVNWNLHTRLFTVNPTHKKISGGHKENGVFLTNIPLTNFKASRHITMDNLFSTLLELFDLDASAFSKGESFIKVHG
jgi:predicted AlkP superfamily phosphohydrolase/phosphomutase